MLYLTQIAFFVYANFLMNELPKVFDDITGDDEGRHTDLVHSEKWL